MNKEWLGKVQLYNDHKDIYNESERCEIKKVLKEQMSERLIYLSNISLKNPYKIKHL